MTTAQNTLTGTDTQELHELIVNDAWLLDHGRWHAVVEQFLDDGRLELGPNVFDGRDALRSWADRRAANPGRRTRHQCTNIQLRASGDGGATGTVMVIVYVSTDGQPAELDFVGEFHDRYHRDTKGRWRFQQRTLVSITDPI